MTQHLDPSFIGAAPFDTIVLGASLATLDASNARDAFDTATSSAPAGAATAGYGAIADAALAWRDGLLAYVGSASGLTQAQRDHVGTCITLDGGWITPGLVDCHTHVVFAGNRAAEAELRLRGASYQDIARMDGGIAATVRDTRAASEDELLRQSLPRGRALRDDGVTTLEIKSGYGLDFANERKMLRVARRVGSELGITVRTSFLGAHALPKDFEGDAGQYIDAVCAWLPRLHDEGLVDAVDAFCETIAFSVAQVQRVFEAADALGLRVKLHADQLTDSGGAALAARFHALSADHVEHTSARGVAAMAASGTVAVLLPGAYHALRETTLPPIDAFRAHGVPMAVASDCNPGTSPLLSLRLGMALACTHFRLPPDEALRGATVHGAQALGLQDRGTLRVGQRADFVHWGVTDPAELGYWMGGQLAQAVYSGGLRVA